MGGFIPKSSVYGHLLLGHRALKVGPNYFNALERGKCVKWFDLNLWPYMANAVLRFV